jgi:hypothetical protein
VSGERVRVASGLLLRDGVGLDVGGEGGGVVLIAVLPVCCLVVSGMEGGGVYLRT